ncbi:lytic transglycosylase domain-containing protein [Pelomicrobium methylotrophicum]|uniref:Lytic transglycosylase domain-containing protein n=1 Tax=Pelomicrobium methylotrophicum TaxID=2602750 RepID=A0A5C7EYE1_9PROT|nr:lytic transglycosylase domain-containing protein [Pelomicrobium methylotrophicum]TXF12081.1 lytic transglycosylase domain-containing protein [Pelomicrobium methylotrophicum]
MRFACAVLTACLPALAWGGDQIYEPLSASVRAALHRAVSDQAAQTSAFASLDEERRWLAEMSRRLGRHFPDQRAREDFLRTVHYEATRAGLDPQLVLAVIHVESAFRKYAVSPAGARGYMQVMPFWVKEIGEEEHNLFHLRVNLRYGCTILRHYLDLEQGDLYRALGRYNGSLGRPEYPNAVLEAWQKVWSYPETTARAGRGRTRAAPGRRGYRTGSRRPRRLRIRRASVNARHARLTTR